MNRRNSEVGGRNSEIGAVAPLSISLFPLRFPHSAFSRGYTLVEMLIVVTIVGLMASVVVPTLSSTSGAVALEAMARTLAADLRIARHSAVQYNSSYKVTLNLTDKLVPSDSGQQRQRAAAWSIPCRTEPVERPSTWISSVLDGWSNRMSPSVARP